MCVVPPPEGRWLDTKKTVKLFQRRHRRAIGGGMMLPIIESGPADDGCPPRIPPAPAGCRRCPGGVHRSNAQTRIAGSRTMTAKLGRRDVSKALAAAGLTAGLGVWEGRAQGMQADTIVRNGRFTTLDRGNPQAEAVAIKDGKFIAVGSEREV